jgi:hypothetical protein
MWRKNFSKKPLTVDGVHLSCEHGLKIYLVDGTRIRNHLDSDFFSGSGFSFKHIPRSEIWIDEAVPEAEIHHLIENECVQAEAVKSGKSIERACSSAEEAEKASRRWEKKLGPTTKTVWKKDTGERLEPNFKVFLVDGNYVRDNMDPTFIQGGNEFRYNFVPKNELWVDWHMPEEEYPYVLFHEHYESLKMKAGWSYERAHDAAKRAENKLRRRDRPGE